VLVGDHFDPTGDLATVFNLKATAARRPEHLPATADDQARTCGQCPIDGAGDLGLLDLDLALEDAARCDRKFGRVDHRRLDGALDDKALGILDHPLEADATPNNERAAFGWIARSRTPKRYAWSSRSSRRCRRSRSGRKRRSGHDWRILERSGAERGNTKTVIQR
jgi:hypothetical protein